MKVLLKWLGRVLLMFLAIILVWTMLNWSKLKVFPSIISSFYSKEMCSCLYVIGRDEAFCKNYARQYIPIQWVKVDSKKKRVTVKGLWRINSASFVNKRSGCRLEKLQ
ncbi:MAG TPA: hypothetical protein DCE42_16380 [Myxococcales bacterium]|nr:hypothetical protein [Deltaproteobacteria bacterium]HAA56343.1 hypothetical protein [Myxococcales bacterium]